MQIILYKSILCPRCFLAVLFLQQLQREYVQLEVKYIDILSAPEELFTGSIRMIPTLEVGGIRRAFLLPTKKRFRQFILEQGLEEALL